MSRPHAVGREGVVSTTTVLTLMALVSCDDLQERLIRRMTGFFMFRSQLLVIIVVLRINMTWISHVRSLAWGFHTDTCFAGYVLIRFLARLLHLVA